MGVVFALGQIIPFEVGDGFREGAAFLVFGLDPVAQLHDDLPVGQAVAHGFGPLVAPLTPAAAVGDAAFFFYRYGCRQKEHLGFDAGRVHSRSFPERAGLVVE